jgi:hypothetical protein
LWHLAEAFALLCDEGFERPGLVEADIYATELEREDRGGGEEVFEVFFGFGLAEEFTYV